MNEPRVPKKPSIKTPDIALPKLTQSVFPDATSEQMRFMKMLLDAMAQYMSRLSSVEASAAVAGSQPRLARKGEENLFACAAVNVSAAGIAFLAKNTDETKLATHVITSMAYDQVLCVPVGIVDVRCLPFTSNSDTLYLSSTPGLLTDTKPTGSGETVQVVGRKVALPNENAGKCLCLFSSDIAGLSAMIKDTSVDVTDGATTIQETRNLKFVGADVAQGAGSNDAVVTIPSLETTDGTTTVDPVTKLTFSGATVTDSGSGEATITISGGGGVEPVVGTAGESGIVAGMLVHVGSDGVMWKADATSMIRYCTHAVDSVDGSDINCVNVGTLDVLTDADSPYDHTNTYYLSAISKGYATPKPPAVTSGTTFAVRQMIGTGQGARDAGTGKTSITLQLEQGVYI